MHNLLVLRMDGDGHGDPQGLMLPPPGFNVPTIGRVRVGKIGLNLGFTGPENPETTWLTWKFTGSRVQRLFL